MTEIIESRTPEQWASAGDVRADWERWRVGEHYNVHVYEDERPVATFFTAIDARTAVEDHNELRSRVAELETQRQAVLDLCDQAELDTWRVNTEDIRAALGVSGTREDEQ